MKTDVHSKYADLRFIALSHSHLLLSTMHDALFIPLLRWPQIVWLEEYRIERSVSECSEIKLTNCCYVGDNFASANDGNDSFQMNKQLVFNKHRPWKERRVWTYFAAWLWHIHFLQLGTGERHRQPLLQSQWRNIQCAQIMWYDMIRICCYSIWLFSQSRKYIVSIDLSQKLAFEQIFSV